jgi:hypothetical protein
MGKGACRTTTVRTSVFFLIGESFCRRGCFYSARVRGGKNTSFQGDLMNELDGDALAKRRRYELPASAAEAGSTGVNIHLN